MARGRRGGNNNPTGINQYSMGMRGSKGYKPRTTKVAVPVRISGRGGKAPAHPRSTRVSPKGSSGIEYNRYGNGRNIPTRTVRVAQANRKHSRGLRTLAGAALSQLGRSAG